MHAFAIVAVIDVGYGRFGLLLKVACWWCVCCVCCNYVVIAVIAGVSVCAADKAIADLCCVSCC